jgi:enoyl-CoA hydratase/carnithine racemase
MRKSAGRGDVKSMAEGSAEPNFEEAVERLRNRMEAARMLQEIEKPTIAMAKLTPNSPGEGRQLLSALQGL